jgi:hypothetical protein
MAQNKKEKHESRKENKIKKTKSGEEEAEKA